MHFPRLATLFALASGALGWEIAIYNDQNCNAGDNFDYYIYSGSTTQCVSLEVQIPSDTACDFYTNGGANGPFVPCRTQPGAFPTSSSFRFNAGADCYFYRGRNCIGDGFGSTDSSCQNQAIQSFSCTG